MNRKGFGATITSHCLSILLSFFILINPAQTKQIGNSPALPTEPVKVIQFSPWELVTAVAWSPDDSLLAVAAGNQIYIFGAINWEVKVVLPIEALTPALAFSPDGSILAIASRDGMIRAWKISEFWKHSQPADDIYKPVWEALAHRKGANSLAFSPDGDYLASGGNDSMAKVWEIGSQNPLLSLIGGTFSVPSIAFSPDGSTLAVMNGGVIRLRDFQTGRLTGTIRADYPLFSLAYSPDGKILAAGGSNNEIYLWDPSQAFKTGKSTYPVPQTLVGHNGKPGSTRSLIWRLAFSPEGSRLASAGGDGTVRLWKTENARMIGTLYGHSNAVTSLAFQTDGDLLASGSLDGTVRIWQLNN